jgi:hypothetical protein
MEDLVAPRSLVVDLLALAMGLALGIVIVLFWCVEVVAGQWLPTWYYGAGVVAMTAAIYAQLRQQQRNEEDA